MELVDVKTLTDIKQGDTIIITGDNLVNEAVKAVIVKVTEEDGTEIIFNKKLNKYLNDLTEALLYIDAEDSKEINQIEKEYNCSIIVYIEKHNVLQFTYYYEITIPDC